jgi:hypothetical protein
MTRQPTIRSPEAADFCDPSASAVLGEDLAQGGGERLRLALHPELAAEETGVVAGEDDGLGPESFRHGHRGAVGQLTLGCLQWGSGGTPARR